MLRRARWGPGEIAFWLVAVAAIVVFSDRYLILTEMAWLGLFALSLDLILGYAGIVSLGHAAFFGVGAYAAGLLAVHGVVKEPVLALVIAGLAATVLGFATSFLVIRGSELSQLMVTLGIALLLRELANKFSDITGGFDGLQGIVIDPILPVRLRYLWQGRLHLLPRGAVRAVPAGAADRAFAVRPVAARDPQ